ncbi:MAG: hypothetical protein GXN92_03425 [Candidatus Micrarchaeota archaeon]|nr:hypothetical protein [Candidatus Micrarchaeota archaeon]
MLWLLLLIALSYGYDACYPGFDEEIVIRVLDEMGRPVPGVNVQLQYLLDGSILPRQYRWTPVKQTDEFGLVSFYVFNRQKSWVGFDCSIKVNMTLFDYPYSYVIKRNKTYWKSDFILTLKNKTSQYVYRIPAYRLTLLFKEGNKSVPVKLILFDDYVYENVTKFEGYVPPNVSGLAVYKGIKRYFNYVLQNDSTYVIQFQQLPYTLIVMDDAENPLACTFNNMSFVGTLEFKEFASSVTGTLNCSGKTKVVTLTPYRPVQVILDVTPPQVTNFRLIKADTEYVTFAFDVWDPNKYASGLKRVEVKFLGSKYMPIDKKGSSYYYRIPNVPGTIHIYAVDNMDNVKEVVVNYTPAYEELPQAEEEKKEEEGEGDITWLVVGVGIIVLGGIIWFIKSKFEEPEEV